MAASEVEIANSALVKLGTEPIASLDDDNKRARFAKEQFAKVRDDLLRAHPWNFAIKRVQLARLATTPAFEYDYEYLIPSDVLRILHTNLNTPVRTLEEVAWAIEQDGDGNKVLRTNETSVQIKYVSRVTEVALFDPSFVEVLALKLAADLAYGLVQSSTLQQQLYSQYLRALSDARVFDAQEGSIPTVEADILLDIRG